MKAYKRYNMTLAERKAMEREIKNTIAENMKRLEKSIDVCVLYCLREKYGFGKIRLLDFQKDFRKLLSELIKRYEIDKDETTWICQEKLEEIGIDVNSFDCKEPLLDYKITK